MEHKKLKVLELFSGIGACSKALDRLGIDHITVDSVEIDKYAVKAFNAIHGTNFEPQDITEWDKNYWCPKCGHTFIDGNYGVFDDEAHDTCPKCGAKAFPLKGNVDLIMHGSPCLTADSLILTQRGYIPLSEVEIGDKVLTKSNTWHEVEKKFDNGVKDTLYLQGMGFENIHCTPEHKFYARYSHRVGHFGKRVIDKPTFVEAKDLIPSKHYLGVPVLQEQTEWKTNDLDFWYLVGLYLGDGWLKKGKCYDIVFGLNKTKLEKAKRYVDFDKWGIAVYDEGTSQRARFANKDFYRFIEQNIGTGCFEKQIPYEILALPHDQLNAVYSGYLDSDGCIIGNIRQFTSVNRSLIYGLGAMINKLFHRPIRLYKVNTNPKTVIQGRTVNQHDYYLLRFSQEARKREQAFYENGYIWYQYRGATKGEQENVYNMQVNTDHSYVVQGCISKNCQDFSVAGLGAGGDKGSGTRSSLMYETLRIVEKLEPKYVLWENVKNLISKKHKHNFDAYVESMENLGYTSVYKVLNAKDFGVPQNREWVYTISIRKDLNQAFEFPKGIPLTIRLKDVLEQSVDEKYYLTNEQVSRIKMTTYVSGSEKVRIQDTEGVARTLCARDYKDPKVVREGSRWGTHQAGQIYDKNGLSPTLNTAQGGGRTPMFIENEAEIIEHNKNPKHQQDLVQDEEGICRTIPAGTHGSTPHLLKTVVREEEPKLEYVGGIGDTDRIGDGKELGRNYPQGNRVYSTEGIAVSQTANGGGLGGPSGLYLEPQPIKRRRSEYGKEVRKSYENHELGRSEAMKEAYIADDGIMPTITASKREQRIVEPYIAASRGRSEGDWKDTEHFQQLEPRTDGVSNTLSSVQKDNYVVEPQGFGEEPQGFVENAYSEFIKENGYMPEMFNPYNQAEIKEIAPTQTTQAGSTTASSAVLIQDQPLLKTKLCKELIEKGVVKGGEIINHSYTNSEQRTTLDKYIENKEGIMPTITTRPDCLGYVEKTNKVCYNTNDEKRCQELAEVLQILREKIGEKAFCKWAIGGLWCILQEAVLWQNVYAKELFESWKAQPNLVECSYDSEVDKRTDITEKTVRDMWVKWQAGYPPHRRELSEQQFGQLKSAVQKLPYETTSQKGFVQDLWQASEGLRLLRQALSEIREVWESQPGWKVQRQGLRIRKLTPLCTWRLMGFDDEDYYKAESAGVSSSQLYKMAGNSIVVNVLEAIIKNLVPQEYYLES